MNGFMLLSVASSLYLTFHILDQCLCDDPVSLSREQNKKLKYSPLQRSLILRSSRSTHYKDLVHHRKILPSTMLKKWKMFFYKHWCISWTRWEFHLRVTSNGQVQRIWKVPSKSFLPSLQHYGELVLMHFAFFAGYIKYITMTFLTFRKS